MLITTAKFIMPLDDLETFVTQAQQPSPWDVGNEVLYNMCRQHPYHADVPTTVAKVWLIGRSYAAAIERGRNKARNDENDDFYIHTVGPKIVAAPIDTWLGEAKKCDCASEAAVNTMLEVHNNTMELFREISKHKNRSLASKYLHFHVPALFFIYDSRAESAMRYFASVVGRATKDKSQYDNEYRKFVEKCISLRSHIDKKYRVHLSPRQLDNLLLLVYAAQHGRMGRA